MCGIVGYVGNSVVKPLLLEGLSRLEYRGYDSAGFALYSRQKNSFVIRRAVGVVQELVDSTLDVGQTETQGIAHTRWATHGVPNETNAHPHQAGKVVLVHNGIIENHAQLKANFAAKGIPFLSQTDTEVFARLIESCREDLVSKSGSKFEDMTISAKRDLVIRALSNAAKEVHGHYAIVFMVEGVEGFLFGLQNGAPLVMAQTPDGTFLASDLQPLIRHTRSVSFVPVGVIFEMEGTGFKYLDAATLKPVAAQVEKIEWSAEQVAKDGFEHFMLKEIFQQPIVVADTLSGRLPDSPREAFGWDNRSAHEALWQNATKIYLVACGTAYHAAMVAKYYFEKWARISVEVDLASEFRYRTPVFEMGTVLGVISQSGETADTLGALRVATEAGVPTFSICNVPGSTIMRESSFQYSTKAGPEIGVASTKAFTTQLTVLCGLAQDLARMRGHFSHVPASLARLPHDMEAVLAHAKVYQELGSKLADKKTILFVGRGTMYPIALEGALKLKEITYRHAEGYAAGELKHGPIALVDKNLAAVVLAPNDELLPKTLSNLEEIKSRGGMIIGIGESGNTAFQSLCDHYVPMPPTNDANAPILYVIPLQLISYGLAKSLDCNIDKPRNLAKSVTVE